MIYEESNVLLGVIILLCGNVANVHAETIDG